VSGRVCWWQETTTKCMTRSLNVTPKTTLRSGKSEAEVTIIRLRTSYFVEANYWRTQSITRPLCTSRATCFNKTAKSESYSNINSIRHFYHHVLWALNYESQLLTARISLLRAENQMIMTYVLCNERECTPNTNSDASITFTNQYWHGSVLYIGAKPIGYIQYTYNVAIYGDREISTQTPAYQRLRWLLDLWVPTWLLQ